MNLESLMSQGDIGEKDLERNKLIGQLLMSGGIASGSPVGGLGALLGAYMQHKANKREDEFQNALNMGPPSINL